MTMGKVLVCDPIHEDGIRMLRAAKLQVDCRAGISHDELLRVVEDYDAIIVRSRTKVGKDVLRAAKGLKVIGRAGVGVDNIDVEEAIKHGIEVETSSSAPIASVAELVFGLMIGLARSIPRADRLMKEGKWAKKELMGTQLQGKTIGIVGLGRIGRAVGKRARAFGMRVLVRTRHPNRKMDALRELDAEVVSLEELLRRSDFVTLHVPLTEETYHMIGEGELRLMKRTAYLINTSRGGVVDTRALIEALRGGWIAGAALDVYEKEPPDDPALVGMPNVICTPHIGSQTVEAQRACATIIAKKVIEALRG
ncbi:TPA: hydroxyacid dehydrogenase [Candidatus Bathyarchaeota archaeon]|nr:hydroxyacid dehydrogenase [Candidatus Bathyarchaeota archaeon]